MLSRSNQVCLFSCWFILGSMGLSSAAEKPSAAAAKVTQIVAHRGAATTHPENTLAAFREATQPAFDQWAERVGPELVASFQDAIAQAQ